MAERQGFEPWVPLPGQLISSQLHSTTLAPLREEQILTTQAINVKGICGVWIKFNSGKFVCDEKIQ